MRVIRSSNNINYKECSLVVRYQFHPDDESRISPRTLENFYYISWGSTTVQNTVFFNR
jgi:hypothetical protein